MIQLIGASDLLQVVSSAAGQLDVYASYVDSLSTGVVQVGRLNTRITTAATTTVVGSPGASNARRIKIVSVSNAHATVSQTVRVLLTDGTTAIELESVILAPGERLTYTEGVGMRVVGTLGVPREVVPFVDGNASTADVVANAADTYLAGSNLSNFAPYLQAGTHFKWRLRATKTGAGVTAPIFNIRYGTAGAIGDTARTTVTGAAQTGVADEASFEVDGIFRVAGASAVLQMICNINHRLATTGFATLQYQSLAALSAAFDATPAASIIGLSVNPGALGVWTFQGVSVEVNNLKLT
jgi:hypothetical protein